MWISPENRHEIHYKKHFETPIHGKQLTTLFGIRKVSQSLQISCHFNLVHVPTQHVQLAPLNKPVATGTGVAAGVATLAVFKAFLDYFLGCFFSIFLCLFTSLDSFESFFRGDFLVSFWDADCSSIF